ncbi:hypothetical protein CHGG_04596 [Chaetomium globosum CBS 148.51]|uniref:NEDD8-activating enzyme E1 regulatory subunit n=1 Tax=Chaetomium globosum (strain ATCC 6205 / CBS 148.51 / DSM 1962 / NBRC 6347 / NRRL 1970) TaxID=306901 RepID=Q2H0V0_CHAGB|nr:uncharacterized protein CHGG_04596 [Chaetomium globosum CBS 148.51]EAQ87977.1 hypothetical protein CHGG_04596 [Chaetomium globosum CBS 148.51]
MSQTPPILHGPSEKERKYDRQLRLWAASGQAALESANILLVNSGAGTVGAETLKNLVLPGIGRFAIYDESRVSEADLGVNFFLDDSCLGTSRAQSLTELILELNPDVQGSWYPNEDTKTLDSLLNDSPVFTVIMYTHPIRPEQLSRLEAYGQQHKTPLVAIHSAGFYSYFQINLPGAFPIVDTHPDETATTDLRLLNPWPELVAFAEELTKDIDGLDNFEHGHLPYVVILLHYLESGFWLIADAVKKFYEEHQCLPLPGKLPDMKAQSKVYIQLQGIYKAKARKDAAKILEIVQASPGGEHVNPAEVDLFCKNAAFVKLINATGWRGKQQRCEDQQSRSFEGSGGRVIHLHTYRPRQHEEGGEANKKREGSESKESKTNERVASPPLTYQTASSPTTRPPLSRSPRSPCYQSTSPSKRQPTGGFSADAILAAVAQAVPGAEKREGVVQAAHEVARAAGGELHNVAALTGGMVAQETIKIVTKQYIPADNTCVYDGIGGRVQVLRL